MNPYLRELRLANDLIIANRDMRYWTPSCKDVIRLCKALITVWDELSALKHTECKAKVRYWMKRNKKLTAQNKIMQDALKALTNEVAREALAKVKELECPNQKHTAIEEIK